MRIHKLWLQDFRSYPALQIEFQDGLTCVIGENGIGKTNLLEAIGFCGSLKSFRGADSQTMISKDAQTAVVRAEISNLGRKLLIETELSRKTRTRAELNRQRIRKTSDLLMVAPISVFAPDDLATIKSSPAKRRDFLDDAVVALWPRQDEVRQTLNRSLRQRNALLRQFGGKEPKGDAALTLEIWDERFAIAGEQLGSARVELLGRLQDHVAVAYKKLSRRDDRVELFYKPKWFDKGLSDALLESRNSDLRRGITLIGPHRDDLEVWLNGMPSRTHASQGEQRTLALALCLGLHTLLSEYHREAPLLLLDDVFSELDINRTTALFDALPAGQAILTTASAIPSNVEPQAIYRAQPGTLEKVL